MARWTGEYDSDDFIHNKTYFYSGYYYNIAICDFDPAEDNYEDFCNLASTRFDNSPGAEEFFPFCSYF